MYNNSVAELLERGSMEFIRKVKLLSFRVNAMEGRHLLLARLARIVLPHRQIASW
jgi:hypothetical protein